ncbi:MAG: bifunctional folylpolyglutamate synthase/dihydrofolate synthase [Prevotella sp.]|nr:bifunctional folylpolyglutamate synthase/dihydrofolate synthase [Prevotella sp.]MBQ7716350.1 bifunctional folylpolyglutamate synthase/dihydrofolate synthase [Prevotella sp.]MBQ9571411.1 bifunctional folylpolyglutamate synthase/dihydrofolate synthase [Prevotella sp.]
MNYQETIEYLYHAAPTFQKVGAAGYKEGLDNTLALDEHFGHPHQQYKTIHVAGTNGKGSCSHTIAAILQAAGMKVGLYTSPHLVDFRERIKINGQCVSKEYVIDFVEQERAFFEPLHPSFFEITTAMAFKYFADEKVDIAVIEVGLGGRLDCTNIITPILSVITNISKDHTQFLGNTLHEIAGEKAGIIKRGVPVVIGETVPETKEVFLEKASQMEAPILFAENFDISKYQDYDFELKGSYQEKNRRTILCAAQQLELPEEAIRQGMLEVCQTTGLMGRWQQLQSTPTVICDTGHNVGGWEYLSEQIRMQSCRQCRIVFGMVDDKEIDKVMAMLPKDAVYYWTQAETKRAVDVSYVKALGDSLSLQGTSYPDVLTAYHAALNEAAADDFIFVGGSSYVVADLLAGL